MKKLILIFLCTCLLLTSCASSKGLIYSEIGFWSVLFKSDDYVCSTVLEKIVHSLETDDNELLLSIFSENTRAECLDLQKQAKALLNYCTGKMISWGEYRGLPNTSAHYSEEELVEKSHIPTYDINTTDGSYRITFEYVEIDTNNTSNEGVTSLYVIKAEDDINLDYAYRMSEYVPGIHIGVTDDSFDY